MTVEDHAERMAIYLVELMGYLTDRQQDKARRLVKAYRDEQREAVAARSQGTMFEGTARAVVPWAAQDTSIAAAGAIAPHARSIRERVFAAIAEKPDTAEGLGLRLSLSGDTIRPRLVELRSASRVVDSGDRHPLTSGNMGIVWEAVKDPRLWTPDK